MPRRKRVPFRCRVFTPPTLEPVAGPPLPSFPRKRESGGGWAAKGWSFQYRRDSRLRGKDGRDPIPLILNLLKDGQDGSREAAATNPSAHSELVEGWERRQKGAGGPLDQVCYIKSRGALARRPAALL